jgi:hypothetical protein
MLFFVQASTTNTGACSLNIDNVGAVQIYKRGNIPLEPQDIKARQVFAVVYFDAKFHLVSGSGSSGSSSGEEGSGVNFTGVNHYESEATDIPAEGASATFNHAMGTVPTEVRVYLRNETADLGYVPGDLVPLENVNDENNRIPLAVKIDDQNIVILTIDDAIYIPAVADGSIATAITNASWSIIVIAERIVSTTGNLFPATEMMVSRAEGAVSFGSSLYYLARSRGADKTYLHKIDLGTGQVTIIGDGISNTNAKAFQLAPMIYDGDDVIIFTDRRGIGRFDLQDPSAFDDSNYFDTASGGTAYLYRPVHLDTTASGASTDHPDFYCIASDFDQDPTTGFHMSAIRMKLAHWGGASYALTTHGSDFDLTDGDIVNIAAFQKHHPASGTGRFISIQYNPVKGRLYVLSAEDGLLHIFNIADYLAADTANTIATWWSIADTATRAGNLVYEKAIVLAGYGASFTSTDNGWTSSERPTIEFDLTTGEEKSVSWAKRGGSTDSVGDNNIPLPGTVARVPWRE